MTEKFVASDGAEVTHDCCGLHVKLAGKWSTTIYNDKPLTALREFFLHERDRELGRWRWPESTSIVVYEVTPGDLRILEEEGGTVWGYEFGKSNPRCPTPVADAGEAYFAAHPKPKPWHDAEPGEVWVLTVNGDEGPFLSHNNWLDGTVNLTASNGTTVQSHDDEQITAGRKIWPVSDV